MITHSDIWTAIDKLAEIHGYSPSGLAKKAGLSSTLFNPSKRQSKTRKRWPSTESIAAILRVTNTSIDDFIALAKPRIHSGQKMPVLSTSQATAREAYDSETGALVREKWDEMLLPASNDADAFALEVVGKKFEPVYSEGQILVMSPAEKPRRGDRVAVCTKNYDVLVMLLGREGAQKVELTPIGTDLPPMTFNKGDILWMHRITWVSQ